MSGTVSGNDTGDARSLSRKSAPAGLAHQQLSITLAPMVGRTAERAAIDGLLRNPDVRLLVLSGPGGVGKTRLALSMLETVGDHFPDGIVFVDLAPLTSASEVIPAIATALGVRDRADVSTLAALHEALDDRVMLIVLDNMEHVTDAALSLPTLLTAHPRLTFLATSRAVLSVYGEHVYPVAPLSVASLTATNRSPVEALLASDAGQLFVRRAAAARNDFAVTSDNAADIATICRLLDGLPLAIELAAARIAILTPRMLVQRLQRLLPLLDDGPRNVPDRLRTMRNAIDWSYNLLSPTEQAGFRRLAIHHGSWSLADATETVADLDAGPEDELVVLDMLSSLVDKSLIRQVDALLDSPRFTLLQVLRDFGLEQLELTGERKAVEHRHAHTMLAHVEEAAPHLTGRDQAAWLERLSLALPDLQAAITWALEHDPPDLALRLATAFWRFSYTRGPTNRGRIWLQSALDRCPEITPLRGNALNGLAILAGIERDLDTAFAAHTEALQIGEATGDRYVTAMAHMGLGDTATSRGNADEALVHYARARTIFNEIGDLRNIAVAMTNVGNLLWNQQQLDEAIATHEHARHLYSNVGDARGLAWSHTNVGRIAVQQRDFTRAIPNLEQALVHYQALGDAGGYAETLEAIARVGLETGHASQACAVMAIAATLRDEVNHPVPLLDQTEYEALMSDIRTALGAAFDQTWTANSGKTLEDASEIVSAILHLGNQTGQPAPPAPAAVETVDTFGLSEREREVLFFVAAGKTDREIAEELFIGVRTVQSHVANVLTKLEVTARSAAVAKAMRAGIIT